VAQVYRGRQALPDHKGNLALLGLKANQDLKASPVFMENQGPQDRKVNPGLLDLKAVQIHYLLV
jgi:hypothetical protein